MEISLQPFHTGRIGAPEGIDGLIVISHRIEIFVLVRQKPDHGILGRIDILEFIHQDIGKPALPGLQKAFAGPEQAETFHYHVVIVDQIVFLQEGGIVLQDPLKDIGIGEGSGYRVFSAGGAFAAGDLGNKGFQRGL